MRIIELIIDEQDEQSGIDAVSVVLPNKQIYRRNAKNEEYYIYFSSDTIRKASELFLMRSNQNNATYEHEKKLTGLSVVESWIIEDEEKDKSKLYGFDLPKGTWMISMKVNNEEVWNDVKEGKVKGFSIEGYFADKFEMSAEEDEATEVVNELKKLLNIK